jgi:hypothetical protein
VPLCAGNVLTGWFVRQIDMVEQRVISREEGSSLAARMGCEYFETSAKTGAGVEDAFMAMGEHIMCGGPRRERRKLLAAKQRLLWARAATAILTTPVCPALVCYCSNCGQLDPNRAPLELACVCGLH